MGANQQLFVSYGPSFVGPLDAYAAGGLAIWGLSYRLFTSWAGALFRVRRTGDDELDIEAKPDGLYDLAVLSSFVGSDPWWFSQFYDQTGNGHHLTYAASGQPRGAVDGNGLAYAYATTGPNDVAMIRESLSIAGNATMCWTVNAVPSFAMYGTMFRDFALTTERKIVNVGNALVANINVPATGTVPDNIASTTGVCSNTLQVGAGGCRMSIGTVATTGTRTSESITINRIGIGFTGDFPYWVADAKCYAGGLWLADMSDTDTDAIQQIGKDLYFAQ